MPMLHGNTLGSQDVQTVLIFHETITSISPQFYSSISSSDSVRLFLWVTIRTVSILGNCLNLDVSRIYSQVHGTLVFNNGLFNFSLKQRMELCVDVPSEVEDTISFDFVMFLQFLP